MSELTRANRVAVGVAQDGGGYVATFYKTHTTVGTIHQANAEGFEIPEDTNKAMARELFRQYVVENCKDFGIDYDPQDRRQGFVPKAQYTDDDAVIKDAVGLALPIMQGFAEKLAEKYPIKWKGIDASVVEITPMKTTASGKDLSTLGIEDGKYAKSGNWAWADLALSMTIGYKDSEVYVPFAMQLVSGQIKKSSMTITKFTEAVKAEIIEAGLATAEELDPPKEKKSKAKKSKTDVDETTVEETAVEEEVPEKKTRQRKSKAKESA